jgi:hypothetical protein
VALSRRLSGNASDQAAYSACKASSSTTASRRAVDDCGGLLPAGDGLRPAVVVLADERGIAPVVRHCAPVTPSPRPRWCNVTGRDTSFRSAATDVAAWPDAVGGSAAEPPTLYQPDMAEPDGATTSACPHLISPLSCAASPQPRHTGPDLTSRGQRALRDITASNCREWEADFQLATTGRLIR